MYQEQFHFALNAYWLGLSDADSSEIQGIQNLVFLTPKQAANYLHLSSKTIWNHTFYEIVAEEIRQEKLVDRLYTRIFASPDFLKNKKILDKELKIIAIGKILLTSIQAMKIPMRIPTAISADGGGAESANTSFI